MIKQTIALLLAAVSSSFLVPLAAATAQAGQQVSIWSHQASGATFPREIEQQRIASTKDLGSPYDSVVDYAGVDPRESTTVYIFRAAYPDARLWFDQVLGSTGKRIPLDIFEAGPEQPVRAFGSDAPNALQRVYSTSQTGPFRSTSIFVAQAGEWLVKIYASSPTLDRAGLAARIAAFTDKIRFPLSTPFAPVAAQLPSCSAPRFSGRAVQPDEERLAVAVGAGLAVLRRSQGPLANGGRGWCRVSGTQAATPIVMLRRLDERAGWILLVGDAGHALTTITAGELDLTGNTTTLAVSTPAVVGVAGIYDGVPDPLTALQQALPVLKGERAMISYEGGKAIIGPGQPATPRK